MLKFRHKIILLVTLALGALAAVTVVAVVMNQRSSRELHRLETRYLPLLELDRDLKDLFARIPRVLEGAVSADEQSQIVEADALRDSFALRLNGGADTIAENGADPAALLADFQKYYALARAVSEGMIAGDAGEEMVARIEQMRAAQQAFATALDHATAPDRGQMKAAFDEARQAQRTAVTVDIAVALAGLLLMLALSWGIVRGTVQSLAAIGGGVRRFARGDLGQEIAVTTRDEFGELAREANETGARLREYRAQNDREDWIKTGVAGLATEVAGEQHAKLLGGKALAFLARYAGAVLGAAYAVDEHGSCSLLDVYSFASGASVPGRFAAGEGLVGQAARDGELRVIGEVPAAYASVRSAIGEGAPRHLVIVPFGHEGRVRGVFELGFLHEASERALELLRRIRDVLGVAFDVAESRLRVQALLDETQAQAEELKEAYDVAEARNRALVVSEQQLQATNEELEAQAAALVEERARVETQNDELRRSGLLLEERARELARVSGFKSMFLANMSHELRTPLNSILILSKILGENGAENLTAKQVELAGVIHKAGQELLTLINDILDLAKIESGREELVLDTLPLGELATYVRTMFGPIAAQRQLELEVRLADGPPAAIRADRNRLHQILKNLLSNALKFTAHGGVTLAIGPAEPGAGDAVLITVTDTGIGIPPEKHALIFEAFAQADGGTSRKFGGTGLGLTISRQLAVRMGGSLQVASEVGRGTTFSLTLPVLGPDAAAVPEPAAPEPAMAGSEEEPPIPDDRDRLAPGVPTLLIVEDDLVFASLVLGMARDAGFNGIVARSGQAGLALAERHRPTGIILDVGLPDRDGWSVMERLKADPATRDIPVHFITASEGADRARRLGAVGFARKPISAADIKSAIAGLDKPRRTVLAVEGGAVRAGLEELLATGTGLEAVATAAEARARLAAGEYGCLVIDLEAVGSREGLALAAETRADPHTASLPVIVWTERPPPAEALQRFDGDDQTRIILKGEKSKERMIEEARLFLQRVRTGGAPAAESAGAGDDVFAGKKVLIVDDDMRNVYSLSHALRAKGLTVVAAADGKEAFDRLAENADVRLVLMDVMMPQVDGYEATRRIRQDPRWARLPIIAVTAKTMPGDRKKCLEAGADDFIAKPLDLDRLFNLLRGWLAEPVRPAG